MRLAAFAGAAACGLCAFALAGAFAATPQVSASRGTGHALALKSDGTVVAWGNDVYGQLGTGRTLVNGTPSKVAGLPGITSISAFLDHVLALDAAGRVWSWGNNTFAQLGERVERNSAKPGQVLGLSGVVAVEAGHHLSVALKSDGTLWIWGRYQQVDGDDDADFVQDNPTPVQKLTGVVEIAAGARHVLARKADNTVWALGQNLSGQLGLGDTAFRNDFVQVPGLANVTRIAAADNTSGAVTASGALYLWGQMNFGSGGGLRTSPISTPGLPGGDPIVDFDVRGGGYGFIALASRRIFRLDDNFALHELTTPLPSASPIVNVSAASATGQAGTVVLQDGTGHVWTTNVFGTAGNGSTTPTTMGNQWFQPTGMSALKAIEAGRSTIFALTQSGEVWVWGLDSEGLFGNGLITVSSVPRSVVGLPSNIVSVQAGYFYSLALGADGKVWGWGNNGAGELGRGYGQPPASTPVQASITGVSAIAACASANSLYLKPDGTVWYVGMQVLNMVSGTQVAGLPPIAKIGCAWQAYYAIDTLGRLWAWGENKDGLVGDGTFADRQQPVQVNAFGGVAVTAVTGTHYGLALTADGRVWLWGRNPALGGDNPPAPNPTPTAIAGISGATAISAGANHVMIRLADGTVRSFGIPSAALALPDDSEHLAQTPQAPLGVGTVESMAAGSSASFGVRGDGTVFAWGKNCTAAQECQTLGDGTFSERDRPVVMLRENAAGNLDTNDWFLDLKPGVAKAIPPDKVPRMIPVTTALSGGGLLNFDAAINYRVSDNGRRVGVYVVALVPPQFLTAVKASKVEIDRARMRVKDGEPVLVQLTPYGWTTVTGQLIAFTTTVVSGNGTANNILDNIPAASIPGARFCIGYGSDAANMLSEGTLHDVVALPGAASYVSGSPCVLAGVYVSGPAASIAGSAVDFRATVVGAASPSGTVQFHDGAAPIGAPLVVSPVNAAVASAQISTSSLAPGDHGIGAEYSGDANNPPSRAEAIVHRVSPAASVTSVALSGPASSRAGAEVAFTAVVTGRAPTGTVQFRDGAAPLGPPIALAQGSAVLRISSLAAGAHSIEASYSGDGSNQASAAAPLSHRVAADLATEVALTASTDRPTIGQPVTFTATVTGSDPTGSLTVRDESTGSTYGPAALVSGTAQVTASDLAIGAHLLTATYSGDGANTAATSAPIVVAVQPPGPPRLVNISTRMQVLTGDDVLIGGFIIGGSTPKTVVVRARGPSMAAFGVPGLLADPVLTLYSGQTPIASNNDWAASPNVSALQASGFAPSDPRESAIHTTLNPGPYTAIVSGAGATTGVGIIEVFEVNATAVPLINISTRGKVLTGDNVMIGGFIIHGSGPQTVVVRARGPSLSAHGVPNVLANPVLNLYSGQTLIASNNDWQAAANVATLQSSGFAPENPAEAAIYITLDPGAYTAIVTGQGGTTGVGIVEVFKVQ